MEKYIIDSISVDGAYDTKNMEYKGVDVKTKKIIFHKKFPVGTNNIAEFLAIVHALALLHKDKSEIPVYSDSYCAIKWIEKKRVNSTLPLSKETEEMWNIIHRAEKWLGENNYKNKVLKWNTKAWGECPADFGRKK